MTSSGTAHNAPQGMHQLLASVSEHQYDARWREAPHATFMRSMTQAATHVGTCADIISGLASCAAASTNAALASAPAHPSMLFTSVDAIASTNNVGYGAAALAAGNGVLLASLIFGLRS